MRPGKREREAIAQRRILMERARERAALVPDNGGRYSSALRVGRLPIGNGRVNSCGWSDANERRIAREAKV